MQESSSIQSKDKDYHNLSDLIERAIDKYKHHPSVLSIQSKISSRYEFSLKTSTQEKLVAKTISLEKY